MQGKETCFYFFLTMVYHNIRKNKKTRLSRTKAQLALASNGTKQNCTMSNTLNLYNYIGHLMKLVFDNFTDISSTWGVTVQDHNLYLF